MGEVPFGEGDLAWMAAEGKDDFFCGMDDETSRFVVTTNCAVDIRSLWLF